MSSEPTEHLVCKVAGGELAYSLIGKGPLKAIFFHGFPGSRLQARFLEPHCRKLGIEMAAFDRPGYGYSSPFTPRRARTLALAAEVAVLASTLGWKNFHLLGVSGGAPYALQCASVLGKRVLSTQIVCGLGPLHEKSFRQHFPAKLYAAMLLGICLPAPMLNALARRRSSRQWYPGKYRPFFLSPADFALIQSPEILPEIRASMKDAFRQGVGGAKRDLRAYLSDWRLDWEKIRCPVTFWHGRKDQLVPWQFSEILAGRIESARFVSFPEESHYTLPIQRAPEILRAITKL